MKKYAYTKNPIEPEKNLNFENIKHCILYEENCLNVFNASTTYYILVIQSYSKPGYKPRI